MQRKVFIAINLDDSAKQYLEKKLAVLKRKIETKWTAKENFHITLLYIGFINDQRLGALAKELKDEIEGFVAFDLKIDHLGWGPDSLRRKMIWAQGPECKELVKLRNAVNLVVCGNSCQVSHFKPHITCARLKKNEIKMFREADLTTGIKLDFIVPVQEIYIMESIYVGKKRIYRNLEIIELNK